MAKRLPLTDEEGEVRELTHADFSRARPASRVLPEILGEDLAGQMLKRRPGRRGPQRAPVKRQVTLRLDPEVRGAPARHAAQRPPGATVNVLA